MNNSRPRVIIIDDAVTIRKIFVKALVSLGCDVVGEAGDGAEGVELFQTLAPDLTFLDIEMPNVNGIDALIQIKAINPDSCVVMLSGLEDPTTAETCTLAGASGFLRKDLGLGPLKDEIDNIIQSVR